MYVFFFQAEDGIRDLTVTGVQTCALPISPNNPVFVNRLDGHEALANAAAMRAAAVTKATPTPSGGEILRDLRTGEPTGMFKDPALDLVGHAVPDPSPAPRASALARAPAYAASPGAAA